MFLLILPKYQKGDINHDGKYSTIDVVYIQRYIAGLDNPSCIDKFYLDANGDFAINEQDIEYVQRKIVGLE